MRNYALLTLLLALLMPMMVLSAADNNTVSKDKIRLEGRVKEAITRQDLLKAKVIITDSAGAVVDSATTGGSFYMNSNGVITEYASFWFEVPRRPADYHIEVSAPGYQTLYHTYHLDNIGRREYDRNIDPIFLEREARKLGEVTVTASKVKFYNRGDTIVFNADAFELAEGSMLDALIKQLPGVELREGGQIYVNGEFVENLLLNGKDFFNGKNELMLDNLASYTVKDIEVYRKSSDMDRWAGIGGKKELVMDVKLKKEYNQGWIINLEAGGGTEDRYMLRAFVNRFTNTSRLTLLGNVNNLNDNRKPGESTTWTPETNTTGTMRTQMGGLDYNVQNPDESYKVYGNFTARHTTQTDRRYTDRINFLPSTRTYEHSFVTNRLRNTSLDTRHNVELENKLTYFSMSAGGNYNRTKSDASNLSAAFSTDRQSVTPGLLDTLYNGDPTGLADVINRVKTTTRNSNKTIAGDARVYGSLKVPKTSDIIDVRIGASYNSNKSEVWRDYIVNYGSDPRPAKRQNQYFDNSPNHRASIYAGTGYRYAIDKDKSLGLDYRFTHEQSTKDSYAYALDRLNEEGVFGVLPEGYLATIDPALSYRSHTTDNFHLIRFSSTNWSDGGVNWYFSPSLRLLHRRFDYIRNGMNHRISRQYNTFILSEYDGQLYWNFGEYELNGRKSTHYLLSVRAKITPDLPDPVKMVDMVDNTDPMNIWSGNPDLKPAYTYGGDIHWYFEFPVNGYALGSNIDVIYENTHNALVNGYTYDTTTGVRNNRTYNLSSGNYVGKIHAGTRLQFGSKGQFTSFYRGGLDYIHSADMIGINASTPSKSAVRTWWQAHTLDFSWQLGKQQIGFRGQINSRHTTSDREDFKSITATHSNYTLRGQFNLPKGFGISTDFTLYMRRGYGSPDLDTTDPVWNARVSYSPSKSHWSFMLDGFDLLHKLSNVNYAINAQGQTITYTNVLPRYVMLHVQYKITIQPKKKIINNTRSIEDFMR